MAESAVAKKAELSTNKTTKPKHTTEHSKDPKDTKVTKRSLAGSSGEPNTKKSRTSKGGNKDTECDEAGATADASDAAAAGSASAASADLMLDDRVVGTTWIEDAILALGNGTTGKVSPTHAVAMQIALEFAFTKSVKLDDQTFTTWSALRAVLITMINTSSSIAKSASLGSSTAGATSIHDADPDADPANLTGPPRNTSNMSLTDRTALLSFMAQIKGQHVRFHRCRATIAMQIETELADLYDAPGRSFVPLEEVIKVVVRSVSAALHYSWFSVALDAMKMPTPVFNNSTAEASNFMGLRAQHIHFALRELLSTGFMSDQSHRLGPNDPTLDELQQVILHIAFGESLFALDRPVPLY